MNNLSYPIQKTIMDEINGIFAQNVLADISEILGLYSYYDGSGQMWSGNTNLDYTPTRMVTNFIKKIIKKEARFMFSRTPEIRIESATSPDAAAKIQDYIRKVLSDNEFAKKLTMAGRDCFIGRRVALKLWCGADGVEIMFRPSFEFIYDTEFDESDRMKKIVFFYGLNDEKEKKDQRFWKQKFELEGGRCYITEAIYDGNGKIKEIIHDFNDTGLDFIPAYIIVNDPLTGDLKGESDVAELISNQDRYNRLKSDDADTLMFHMFPVTVAKNASGDCLDNMRIAPNAIIDLQTDQASDGEADIEKLESNFSYSEAYENSINRVKSDMYDIMEVPYITTEQLSGIVQSGKAMKALYWELICKCEERWCAWDSAIKWLVEAILKINSVYGYAKLPEADYTVKIEHLYPIMEDEESERITDLNEVNAKVRSRRNYIEKWNISTDGNAELEAIANENITD